MESLSECIGLKTNSQIVGKQYAETVMDVADTPFSVPVNNLSPAV